METSPLIDGQRARVRIALLGTALVLGTVACSDAPPGAGATQARNVVLIVADDLGYADVSTYAAGRIPTPNIDRIGREGVVFTQAYVTASICSPSRASLLTGRYQQRFGFEFNAGGARRAHDEHLGLDVGERTLADLLRATGVRTAAVGKWHQGSQDEFYPTARGFDEFVGFLPGQTAYIDPDVPGVVNAEADGGGVIVSRETYGELGAIVRGPGREVVENSRSYLTEELTREAVEFIARNQDERFFLYLAHHAPHLPFQTTQQYYDRFPHIADHRSRVYAAMVSALDDGVGAVLDALEQHGLARDTLVLFISDNGCATYTGVCACDPVRGGKFTYLEGGVRVPFVMRWPAGLAAGLVFDEPVSSLDVVPTVLRATGVDPPAEPPGDGVDLGPYLRGERSTPHQALYWRAGPLIAMRQGPWKMWRSRDGEFSYLFDLDADPRETSNVAASNPEQLEALEAGFARWEQDKSAPAWDFRLAPVYGCGEDSLLPF